MSRKTLGEYASMSAVLVLMLGSLSACSSVPMPEEQVQLSRNAVNRAVAADATRYAPVEMKMAQDKLFGMERALGEKRYEQARLIAQQAEADAVLAERKAQAGKAQQTLAAGRNGIQVLRQEMLQAPDAPQTAPTQQP
ncbi:MULTISPECIES: DUF4398 domain-containing protein [Pseudomonas]|uniref:DUF4398 domain-containing protein n=1 Tax=Pseudomonas TaxID=286 RepID=UPI0006D3EF72|nr:MULTISPECIES: DUF4398 domain-containing protein [Pseudomonas]MCE4069419.1 DUF4398 domain-containing protein [Pseudomonas nitritireducens]MCE4079417.1 DUF4398 domain-containing protein [Pseudomonas nitroreducens]OBY92034.1 hypothetical protein A6723_015610 [Pseudomonas sp. AU11447]